MVLDFRNNLDMLSGFTQDAANLSDILATSNERRKNHVHVVFNSKLEVEPVFLRKRREVDVGLWQVNALLGRQFAVVQRHDLQVDVVDLEDPEGHDAVIDIDDLVGLQHLGDILVVDVEELLSACLGVSLIRRERHLVARSKGYIHSASHQSSTDLWTFGVQCDGDWSTGFFLATLTSVVNDRLMVFVRAVTEVLQ